MPEGNYYYLSKNWRCVMALITCLSVADGMCSIAYALHSLLKSINPTSMITIHFVGPLSVLMVIGVIFPACTIIGCRAVFKENMKLMKKCSLVMYGFMFVSLIFEVFTITVYFSVFGNSFPLEKAIITYHKDITASRHIDSLQKTLSCCGINESYDWNLNSQFKCSESNTNPERCNVPFSCCSNEKISRPWNCGLQALNVSNLKTKPTIHLTFGDGCMKKIDNLVFSKMMEIIFLFLILIINELSVCMISLHIITVYEKNRLYGIYV